MKKIIHRDLHPGNILLDESKFNYGFVILQDGLGLKIIDFGVSVKLDKSSDTFEGVDG